MLDLFWSRQRQTSQGRCNARRIALPRCDEEPSEWSVDDSGTPPVGGGGCTAMQLRDDSNEQCVRKEETCLAVQQIKSRDRKSLN